jgi:hypothetical protein
MESQLSLHLKAFNNRVKVMNQTNAKELVLSKLEAQNLQADIFDLLAQIQALSKIKQAEAAENVISINMDGGGF